MFAYCGNTPVNAADYSGKEMCVFIDRDREGYAVGGGIATLWLIGEIINFLTSHPDSRPNDIALEAGAQSIPKSKSQSISIADEKVEDEQ